MTQSSAAAALIDQAKPANNDKATRLLAIRSLGTLGAAEALPFLIAWTKDDDAEIAKAALEATTAINNRGR